MSHALRHIAVVIHPTGSITTLELPMNPIDRIATLKDLVGGCLQTVPLPGARYLVINDDIKSRFPQTNRTATAMARAAESIHPKDYIAGVAVIVPNAALQ